MDNIRVCACAGAGVGAGLSHCNTSPSTAVLCNAAELALAASRPTHDSYDFGGNKGKAANGPEPPWRPALSVFAMRAASNHTNREDTVRQQARPGLPEARAFFDSMSRRPRTLCSDGATSDACACRGRPPLPNHNGLTRQSSARPRSWPRLNAGDRVFAHLGTL
jgi:hypothetical protein